MSLSTNRFYYTNTNHNDASNVLINYHNLTGNDELTEHPLNKYARELFFSPSYNNVFFNSINWANSLGKYKNQNNLINPLVDNVLMNIEVHDPISLISHIVKIGHIDGENTLDHCGYTVSSNADGTIIAISSHWYNYYDQSNYLRGRVRIYKWNNSSWNHIGTIDGEDKESNSGYSTSLSDDGTILAIGAPYNNDGGLNTGHVRVFKYNGSVWNQMGNDIDGKHEGILFGISVSLSADGTIFAAGALYNSGNKGHVRVYKWNDSAWNQMGNDIDGEANNNKFGWSVSLSADGTILAIGATYNDVNTGNENDNTGHVRVYEWNGINWDQLGADIDGEAAGDHSGYSVSLSSDGKIVAIGAERNSGNGNESGHVRVYDYDENRNPEWKQLGSDIDGEAAGNHSGISVSLSSDGTILAVGAPYNNGPANISSIGHVRVYQYVSGLYASDWVQVGYDLDGETETDLFGWSVSLSKNGSTLIVGAYQHDNIGNNSGRVYTYELIKQPITTMAVMGSPIDGDGGSFGGVSLNEDGTVLAIGAYQRSEDEVRVYKYDKIPDELPPSAMTTNETTINSEIFKVSASSEQPPSEPVIDWKWPAEHNVFVNDYHSDYDNGLTPIGGWGNQGRTDGYGVHGPANAGDPTKSSPYHSADYSGPITWRHVDLLFEFDSTAWVSGWRQVGAPGYIGHGDKKQYKSYVKDISVFISDQKDTRPDGAVRTGDTWVDTHESSNGWTYIGSYTHGVDQSGPHPNYTPISFPQSISTSTWEPVPCKYLIIRVESNWGDTYRGGILIIKEMQIKFGIPDTYSPSNAFNYILGTSYHQHYNLSKPYNNDEYTYQGGLDGSFYSTAGHDGEWLQIELPYKIILNKFTLTNSINWGGRMPKTGVVLGQNESSWDVVFTINDIYGAYAGIETRQFYVNNNKYYDTFRLVSTSLFGGDVHDTPSISDWRLFGVKETTKPLWYQMGDNINTGSPQSSGDNGRAMKLNADGTIVAIGAWQGNNNTGDVTIYKYDNINNIWNKLGDKIVGEAEADKSGYSVALSDDGTIVAIGAYDNDATDLPTNSQRGHIRVYEWNGNTWNQIGNDVDGEIGNTRFGWSVSLSANGKILAGGAYLNDGGGKGSGTGHVRVYDYVKDRNPEWKQLGDDIDGEAVNDYFGDTISLNSDGTIIAIGAPNNDGNDTTNSQRGHVRVYQYTNNNWLQMGSDIHGKYLNEYSGKSISLSADGTILVIGAHNYDTPSTTNNKGHAYVYKYMKGLYASDWVLIGDKYGEEDQDHLGWSVSVSKNGSVFALGAPGYDVDGANTGRVYTYQLFEQPSIKSIIKMGEPFNAESAGDLFGYNVSSNADGSVIAFSAFYNDGITNNTSDNRGSIRVYQNFNPNNYQHNYNDHKYFSVIPTSSSVNYHWAIYRLKIIQSGINIVHMDPNNTNELTFVINAQASGTWGWQYSPTNGNNTSVWCNTATPLWYVKTDATIDGTPLLFELIHNHNTNTPYSGNFVSASSPNGPWVVRNSWLINPPLLNPSHTSVTYTPNGTGYIITSDLNSKWLKLGNDIDGEYSGGTLGNSISLNDDGTIIGFGAHLANANGQYSGYASVHKYNDTTKIWDKMGDNIIAEGGDKLGWSTAISADGKIFAVSAKSHDNSKGVVRIYDYDENRVPAWEQLGDDIDGEADSDENGYSISLSSDGSIIAIGARLHNGNSTDSGYVRIYNYDKNRNPKWQQIGSNIDGINQFDYFGHSVSLNVDGTIIAIGAGLGNGINNTPDDCGYVSVYQNINNNWEQMGSTIYGKIVNEYFGHSVSLSNDGNILAIGGYYNTDKAGAGYIGVVRVYKYVSGIYSNDWVQIGNTIYGNEVQSYFGWSVSLSKNGSILLVGAPYTDSNGTDSGSVYTYEIVDTSNTVEQNN
tara:strand:+ start:2633 stop:8311 length:5679 start_codon:yes stop_codon:yes gene_type:complete